MRPMCWRPGQSDVWCCCCFEAASRRFYKKALICAGRYSANWFVVPRFIGAMRVSPGRDRMNAVTTNGGGGILCVFEGMLQGVRE